MRERFATPLRALIPLAVVAALAAACGLASGASEAPDDPIETDATITANALAFDTATITLEAGDARTLRLINLENVPHNVAIYVDESAAQSLFGGELIDRSEIVYRLPPLEPGSYFFRCDLHPEMKGSLLVED
jgi:plastocyanin